MLEFIEYIVKQIATKPEKATVTESKEGDIYVYMITAASEDMGILIGKEGRTIRSIRNMAKAKAIKDNVRIQINIEDSEPKEEND